MTSEKKEELLKERYELKEDLKSLAKIEGTLVLSFPKEAVGLYNHKALSFICINFIRNRIEEIDKELGIYVL